MVSCFFSIGNKSSINLFTAAQAAEKTNMIFYCRFTAFTAAQAAVRPDRDKT